jgi:hypothetical protein
VSTSNPASPEKRIGLFAVQAAAVSLLNCILEILVVAIFYNNYEFPPSIIRAVETADGSMCIFVFSGKNFLLYVNVYEFLPYASLFCVSYNSVSSS